MSRAKVGYIATWGKEIQKNDLEVLTDAVFYFRHIGIDHGEWSLITCLFAHQAKGTIPVTKELIKSYLNVNDTGVTRWLNSLRDNGYIIMSKRKVDDIFIWTLDCSPILEKIKESSFKVEFPAFIVNNSKQMELAI